MTDLANFKDFVRRLGGVWASDDVYFSQTRDCYSADYRPKYPDYCSDDKAIRLSLPGKNRAEYISFDNEAGRYKSKYAEALYGLEPIIKDEAKEESAC